MCDNVFGYTVSGFGSKASRGISAVYIVDDDGSIMSITQDVPGMGKGDVEFGGEVVIPAGAATTIEAYSSVIGGTPSYSYLWGFTEGDDPGGILSPSATSKTTANWTDLVLTADAGGSGQQVMENTLTLRVTDANGSVKFAEDFSFAVSIM